MKDVSLNNIPDQIKNDLLENHQVAINLLKNVVQLIKNPIVKAIVNMVINLIDGILDGLKEKE